MFFSSSSRGGGRGQRGGGRGGRGLQIPQHVLTQIAELSKQRDEARAQIAELVRMRDDARAGSAALKTDYDLLRDSYAETCRVKDQAVADKERAEALLELGCQSANLGRLKCKVLEATLEQERSCTSKTIKELELSLVLTASKLKDAVTLASGLRPTESHASAFAFGAPAPTAAAPTPSFGFGSGAAHTFGSAAARTFGNTPLAEQSASAAPAPPSFAFGATGGAPTASTAPIFAFGGGGSTAPPSGGLFTFGAGAPAAPAFGEGAAPALGGFGGAAHRRHSVGL